MHSKNSRKWFWFPTADRKRVFIFDCWRFWNRNRNLNVSETDPVSHWLWQHLLPHCTTKTGRVKFDFLFDLVTSPKCHECLACSLHNYTSPPIYLQNIVCVTPVFLPKLSGQTSNNHTHNNTPGEQGVKSKQQKSVSQTNQYFGSCI